MAGKGKSQTKPGERIAKAIARAGLASRREAETWIEAGRVAVNGAVIRSPALNVSPDDQITIDGRRLPSRERTRLFLYHKPRGLVTTHADPQGRQTIFGALPKELPRLLSVGRLDINTEGLLLLTNDGGLARVLELPATGWLRRYRVRVHGQARAEELARLRDGITVDGVRYGSIDAELDRVQGANAWITFAMREGKNREVKNVLGHLGLAVNRLIRVSFGPFQLGDLPEGAIAEVKTRHLREQLGERIAALAGADFAGPIVEPEQERHKAPPQPEARVKQGSKKDGQKKDGQKKDGQEFGPSSGKPTVGGRAALEGRHRRQPQDDGAPAKPIKRKRRYERDTERMGEPERARRERRRRGAPPRKGR
jgi:23S rRNA pseudouridine2605 synthase